MNGHTRPIHRMNSSRALCIQAQKAHMATSPLILYKHTVNVFLSRHRQAAVKGTWPRVGHELASTCTDTAAKPTDTNARVRSCSLAHTRATPPLAEKSFRS